jgi:hypothetical protein
MATVTATTSDGSCCCPGTPPPCSCSTYEPPSLLCADITNCVRCTQINRRYRLIKGGTLPSTYSGGVAMNGSGTVTPLANLVWWTGVCGIACSPSAGKWHHLTLFRFATDLCNYSLDDCFSVDEAGTSVFSNWGLFPNRVLPQSNIICDPTFHLTGHVTTNRLQLGTGGACPTCATAADLAAAGGASDSFDVHVFEDASCAGCNPDLLGAPIMRASQGRQVSTLESLPCKWRKGETGDVVECPSCGGGGRVKLKTFKCDVFGRCTIDRKVEGIAMCLGCEARVPPEEPQ